MPLISRSDLPLASQPLGPSQIHVACWRQALAAIDQALHDRGAHASRAVVLLPYFQLIAEAREAWGRHAPQQGAAVFLPQFETTQTWAGLRTDGASPFVPTGTDLRQEMAFDRLTADALLEQAGLGAQQQVLAGRVVEAAWSLAKVAAAVSPGQRLAWGESMGRLLQADFDSPVLAFESAVGRIALAWAASSAYASDRLFDLEPELLVAVEGFQQEPVTAALLARAGSRGMTVALCAEADESVESPPRPALHAAQDAEDEAARATACVLAQLNAGRSPVALVAQDRLLTRRIGAMLLARGVAMRDETGWRLSTTRAAATVMGLLRAAAQGASADDMVDWLKNAPAFAASEVDALEAELRRQKVRAWRELPDFSKPSNDAPADPFRAVRALSARIESIRATLARSGRLPARLRDLREVLVASGQWPALALDDAGRTVIQVLRLHEGQEGEFDNAPSMTLAAFMRWVDDALEGSTFSPPAPAKSRAEVVILPMAQLLGRDVQAVVLPGCDELRLPVSPETAGPWTARQRESLALPSRNDLAAAVRKAWAHAMRLPHVDVLWRASEAGEHVAPSGFVQELMLDHDLAPAPDLRPMREVAAVPTPFPAPEGRALPVTRLSASAYEDLRACPYRFFALRQLGLQEPEELESEVGKRDFGNWLHQALQRFHDALDRAPAQEIRARVAMINIAAEEAAQALGLSGSDFLPFAAIWPQVRDGYLDWLAGHEAEGWRFEAGEVWREIACGDIKLVGKLDRIDVQGGQIQVIDYKTESTNKTRDRIANGTEDTQLAFYAALTDADAPSAIYVNLGEKEKTRDFEQLDIVALRDELVENVIGDLARVHAGAPLPALGEGDACEYCKARGLCRKDFR